MKIHELTVLSASPPVRLSSDDPAATVWEAGEHTPQVIMQRVGHWCWIEIDGVASYRFPREAAGLEVRAEAFTVPLTAGATPAENRVVDAVAASEAAQLERVNDLYYRAVVPLALQVYGLESMHGTALQYDVGAVLLCAPSRAGKSTLAAALAASGAKVIADDGLVWEVPADGAGAYLHPIPFTLMLRGASARRFPPASDGSGSAASAAHTVNVERVAIRLLLLLERIDEAAQPQALRLSRSEAFRRLLAASYVLSLHDERHKRRMMAAYLRFAAVVPVYSFSYPTGFDRLPLVVEYLERLVTEVQSGNSRP